MIIDYVQTRAQMVREQLVSGGIDGAGIREEYLGECHFVKLTGRYGGKIRFVAYAGDVMPN